MAIAELYQRLAFAFAQWRVKTGELNGPASGVHAEDIRAMSTASLEIRVLYYVSASSGISRLTSHNRFT